MIEWDSDRKLPEGRRRGGKERKQRGGAREERRGQKMGPEGRRKDGLVIFYLTLEFPGVGVRRTKF